VFWGRCVLGTLCFGDAVFWDAVFSGRCVFGGSSVNRVKLTHLDSSGAAVMVDVSAKEVSVRQATARATFQTTATVIALLRADDLPKGDALAVARIAGIAAAKRTPELVPLCHPVAIHGVTVNLDVAESSIEITAEVRTADRTGVEMEALTCVTVAGLTLYDMVKAVDRSAVLSEVRLVRKSGGRHGYWDRDVVADASAISPSGAGS
jgi:cyclic pyranopterin phosphate synthase